MNIIVSILLWISYMVSFYFAVFWLLVFVDNKPIKNKPKLKEFPLVSIVIPAFNEEKSIIKTIKHILGLDYPRSKLEVVVVNDGSKDNTRRLVKSFIKENPRFNIKLINQENKGKAAALNSGLRVVNGEYFVVLDADSFVSKGCLKKILPHFTNNVAAVLPSLKVNKPKSIVQKLQWYEYNINMFYKELIGRLNCVHVAPGPFSVYKKSVLVKIGGFDEDRKILTEDLEIVLRLQKNNHKIVQLLNTDVKTIAPKNIKELYNQRKRWNKGAIINAVRHGDMIFNPKYGDFGMMQMPTIIISAIIALIILSSTVYYILKPYLSYINKLSYVNFDFLTFVRGFIFDFKLLDINFTVFFITVVMLGVTIYVIKKAHQSVKEKALNFGVLSLIFYIFAYFFILAFVWVGIGYDFIRGKVQKW